MKKWQYFIGSITSGLLLSFFVFKGIQEFYPNALGVSIPVTYSDGNVLTAAQLNSVNNSIFGAFNSHNHDGGDGEPSTLAFGAVSSSPQFNGDITFNGATSSLEVDGTTSTDLLLDQGNFGAVLGGGTSTADISTFRSLLINSNTGDSNIRLQVNNTSSNAWDINVDNSDGDAMELGYNGSPVVQMTTTGGIASGGQSKTHAIAWETYPNVTLPASGGTCTVVDSTAPGSGVPLLFTCMVNVTDGASGDWSMSGSSLPDEGGFRDCVYTIYDGAGDDLEVCIENDLGCENSDANEEAVCFVVYLI